MKRAFPLVCGILFSFGPAFMSFSAIAEDTCIKLAGSQVKRQEQRQNNAGRPGKLISVQQINGKIGGDEKWCVSEKGITYDEPGGVPIRVFLPFGGGFVHSSAVVSEQPVAITGLATRSGNSISVSWQYTIGKKLTQADYGKLGSWRVEESFSFELAGTSCRMRSYRDTLVINTGSTKLAGVTLGEYTANRTITSNPSCHTM